eukprot:1392707-Amorphochlora_amoeboformis.AAC.1
MKFSEIYGHNEMKFKGKIVSLDELAVIILLELLASKLGEERASNIGFYLNVRKSSHLNGTLFCRRNPH